MGLLHKLWDETLAGPTPDTGLGKLRKHNSFSAAPTTTAIINPQPHDNSISRSITILRTNSTTLRNVNVSVDSGSVPSSPAAFTTPTSPFSPTTPRGDFKELSRRKPTSETLQRVEPRTPTGYDWIVISALDR